MKAQGQEPMKGTRLSGWATGQKGWEEKNKKASETAYITISTQE